MPEFDGAGRVRAAGGVVTRSMRATLEVLLVHRPRDDDWSLPKGKAEPGETDEECARREVAEETGLHCLVVEAIGDSTYVDRFGRPKVVRYWTMDVIGGTFAPGDEVDRIEWLPLHEAIARVTYRRDAEILGSLPTTSKTVD